MVLLITILRQGLNITVKLSTNVNHSFKFQDKIFLLCYGTLAKVDKITFAF